MRPIEVFLGGTCDGEDWRTTQVIPALIKAGIRYFNPIVEDWTEECRIREEAAKIRCEVTLIVITDDIKGVYSIAEAAVIASKQQRYLVFVNATHEQNVGQQMAKSLGSTEKLLMEAGFEHDSVYVVHGMDIQGIMNCLHSIERKIIRGVSLCGMNRATVPANVAAILMNDGTWGQKESDRPEDLEDAYWMDRLAEANRDGE